MTVRSRKILAQASEAGALTAGYVMLRLPLEVRDLFIDWLEAHYPLKKSRVMSLIQDVRGGRDNDTQFGRRLKGRGEVAGLIGQRFERSVNQNGLNRSRCELRTDLFKKPAPNSSQMELF